MKIKRWPILFLKRAFAWWKLKRSRKGWQRKIRKIYKNVILVHEKIPLNTLQYKEKWRKLGKRINTLWYKTYSYVAGIDDINYVPEDIYYLVIEPQLNRSEFNRAYRDKSFYEKYYSQDIFPEILLRNIEGIFYNKDYQLITDPAALLEDINNPRVVVKPSIDSGGGKGVIFFTRKNQKLVDHKNKPLSLKYLKTYYGDNFQLQEYINQHAYFKAFNNKSVNTVRSMTYRSLKNEKVVILHSVLRMGRGDSQVDNEAAGGISCVIKENGTMNEFAVDKLGNKYFSHPSNPALTFAHLEPVPGYQRIKSLAQQIAEENYYFRLLGFDFCVDDSGKVRLIEINNAGLAINFFQMVNGSLFKEYTDEIIAYCQQKK